MQTNMHKLVRMLHNMCGRPTGNNRAAAPTTLFFRSRIQVCAKGKKYLVLRQTTRTASSDSGRGSGVKFQLCCSVYVSICRMFCCQLYCVSHTHCTRALNREQRCRCRCCRCCCCCCSLARCSMFPPQRAVEFQFSIQFQFLSSNSLRLPAFNMKLTDVDVNVASLLPHMHTYKHTHELTTLLYLYCFPVRAVFSSSPLFMYGFNSFSFFNGRTYIHIHIHTDILQNVYINMYVCLMIFPLFAFVRSLAVNRQQHSLCLLSFKQNVAETFATRQHWVGWFYTKIEQYETLRL